MDQPLLCQFVRPSQCHAEHVETNIISEMFNCYRLFTHDFVCDTSKNNFDNYVHCRVKKNVELYDINDCTKMLHSHSVAPHQPVRLCTMSESTLLYIDYSKIPRKVHRLDCRSLPPISPPEYKSLYLSEEMWWDMCFVREHNKNLLIVSSAEMSAIEAYNVDTGSLE